MAKPSYNPYKQALTLLQDKLNLDNIPMITDKKVPKLESIRETVIGFDSDILKEWLTGFQKSQFKKHRTIPQMSAYEVLQCSRQSWYNRNNYDYDESRLGKYPFSSIKAVMGGIIEQLILSMYNQIDGAMKFRNSVELRWECQKELGTMYPLAMLVDGISYDESVILDVKFTDQADPFHFEQVKLYAMAWEKKHNKQCIKYLEVVYLNSLMNAITIRRIDVTDEMRLVQYPKLISRIQEYDKHLREKTLPNGEEHACNFCVYENICKTTGKEQVGQREYEEYTINIKTRDMLVPEPFTYRKKIVSDEIKGTKIKPENHAQPKPVNKIKILL